MEQASDDVLAAVRPQQSAIQRVGMYLFGAVFFGLLPMFLIMPLGLPTGHPACLIAWVFGAVVSTVVIHRKIGRMMDRAHLTLTLSLKAALSTRNANWPIYDVTRKAHERAEAKTVFRDFLSKVGAIAGSQSTDDEAQIAFTILAADQISKKLMSHLHQGRFRIGVVQKLVNLHLICINLSSLE